MRNLDAGLTPALFEDEDTGKVENFKCRSVLQRQLDTRTERPHFGLKFPPAPLKYVLTSAAPLSRLLRLCGGSQVASPRCHVPGRWW